MVEPETLAWAPGLNSCGPWDPHDLLSSPAAFPLLPHEGTPAPTAPDPESQLPLVTPRWETNTAPVSSPDRLRTSVRPQCSSDVHFSEQPLDSTGQRPQWGWDWVCLAPALAPSVCGHVWDRTARFGG